MKSVLAVLLIFMLEERNMINGGLPQSYLSKRNKKKKNYANYAGILYDKVSFSFEKSNSRKESKKTEDICKSLVSLFIFRWSKQRG